MSDYERLTGALGDVRAQGIATALILHGTTGVIEDCLTDYKRAARKSGTDRWVGAHVGAYEHGGGYWDHADVLRYRYDGSPVRTVWFSFNHTQPDLAKLLVQAFTDRGLDASWDGGDGCVEVRLS